MTSSGRRVVILGGGFAGLHAARRLQRTLASRRDVEVVLISRENYVLFTPMLHEVAAGDLDPADIVISLRKTLRRVRLIQAEVADVDLQARVVRYLVGPLRRPRELAYDYLLLAHGIGDELLRDRRHRSGRDDEDPRGRGAAAESYGRPLGGGGTGDGRELAGGD